MSDQNIDMVQGDDLRVIVNVFDQSGSPVDISGATSIKWQLARSTNEAADITKSLANSDITITNNTGFYFDILSSETASLSGGYHHEAEVETASGQVYTTLYGRAYIRPALID